MNKLDQGRGFGQEVRKRVQELALTLVGDGDLAARDLETVESFKGWSRNYDQRNDSETYLAPARLANLARQYLASGAGPIHDLACGTGLLAEHLLAAGFDDLHGSDLSEEMLLRAAQKGLYRSLTRCSLHEVLPFPQEHFAAVTCCGAFYAGSVDVRALAHALPIIRPGGYLICDIEMEAWQDGGYGFVLRKLEEEGYLRLRHCEAVRMFRAGYIGPEEDPELPQGMAVVAQLA